MATKKKKTARRKRHNPLLQVWEHGRCADSGLKLYSALVGGGAEFGPVSASSMTQAKAKLVRIIKRKLG